MESLSSVIKEYDITLIVTVFVALLQIANKLTIHHKEAKGHWLQKSLLILTELLSVLPSRGVGGLKLPMTSKAPTAPATMTIQRQVTGPSSEQ